MLRVRRTLVWFNVELLVVALLLLLLSSVRLRARPAFSSITSTASRLHAIDATSFRCPRHKRRAQVLINCARCAAFNTPLRRNDAPDPNTPPTPAQQWLPAVATEWAFVEAPPLAAVQLVPVDAVVEQPTGTTPTAEPSTAPSKAVLP